MTISVRCPSCSRALNVPDTAAGKRGKCPGCGNAVQIPGANQAVAAAPRKSATAPAAPPPMPARTSKVRSGGGGGDVTPPTTFKKLFLYSILLPIAGSMVIGLGVGLSVLGGVSAASKKISDEELQKAFEESAKTGKPVDLTPSLPWYTYLGIPVDVVGGLIVLGGLVSFYLFLYKAWGLIQDGQARTTPLKAVLFLFIPLFNYYWIFVAIRGLAEDLNNYAKQRQISARESSVGLITAGLVLSLVPCIPGVGALLLLIGANGMKNTCMDIASAKLKLV